MALNIVQVGMGAVGKFFAGKLQKLINDGQHSDVNLYLAAREGSQTYQALKQNRGITLDGKKIDIDPNKVIGDISQVPGPMIVVSSLKGGEPFNKFLEQSSETLREDGRILAALPIQNGVGNSERLAEAIGNEEIVGNAITDVFAATAKDDPSAVEQTNPNYKLVMGHPSGELPEHLDKLFRLYEEAGISNLQESKTIVKDQWIKLMWNTAFNGVCATEDCTIGDIYNDDNKLDRVIDLMQEVWKLANAQGIEISNEEFIHELRRANTREQAQFRTSTGIALDNNQEPEIAPIWGEVVRLGEQHQVLTPKTQAIYDSLTLYKT